jgi:hypothetical protein
MRAVLSALVLLALVLVVQTAAAVPTTINYQGHLSASGGPASGLLAFHFSIYDAQSDGNLLWADMDTLDVVNGLFSAQLGANTAIPTVVFNAPNTWLETAVNGQVMTPRVPLAAVPYAYCAQRADTANVALAGVGGMGLWQSDGTNVWRSSGLVGIGTSTPDQTIGLNGMLGIYPRPWIQPTTKGLFLYHDDNNSAQIYAFDYPSGRADTLGFTAGALGLGTYDGGTPHDRLWVSQNGSIGIGTTQPDAMLDVRGQGEFSDDGASPDTRHYASFGVTRANTDGNHSYIGLTKQQTIPWAIGIGTGNDLIIGTAAAPSKTIPDPIVSISHLGGRTLRMSGNMVVTGVTDNYGNLNVGGNLNVAGTKCRVVETANHGRLNLNAIESGHALFVDDQPSARLVNGRCRVDLSPQFLATVTVDGEHPLAVSVTFYGKHGGDWYVERDDRGFTVVDPSGSSAEFSWQVLARQRDYANAYLEPVPVQTMAK